MVTSWDFIHRLHCCYTAGKDGHYRCKSTELKIYLHWNTIYESDIYRCVVFDICYHVIARDSLGYHHFRKNAGQDELIGKQILMVTSLKCT